MHTKVERKKKENKGKITKRGMRGDPAPTSYMMMHACNVYLCASNNFYLNQKKNMNGGRKTKEQRNT